MSEDEVALLLSEKEDSRDIGHPPVPPEEEDDDDEPVPPEDDDVESVSLPPELPLHAANPASAIPSSKTPNPRRLKPEYDITLPSDMPANMAGT